MVILGLGEEKEDFQILENDKMNTGIEYYYPDKKLKELKVLDRLLVKKYVALLNKVQMVDRKDRFYFVEEQATAIELLCDLSAETSSEEQKNEIIETMKEEIKYLTTKFDRYNKVGMTDFEEKHIEREKTKAYYEFYEKSDYSNIHYEVVKTLTYIYTTN